MMMECCCHFAFITNKTTDEILKHNKISWAPISVPFIVFLWFRVLNTTIHSRIQLPLLVVNVSMIQQKRRFNTWWLLHHVQPHEPVRSISGRYELHNHNTNEVDVYLRVCPFIL